MKYFKLGVVLLMASLAYQVSAHGSYKEYEETITESFEFSTSEPLIELKNIYGDIEITTHEASIANLTVKIIVEAGSEGRAQEAFDRINIEREHSSQSLSVETRIKDRGNWKWSKRGESFSIQYYIAVPKKSNLDVSNKYGDISCPDIANDVNIKLGYGHGSFGNINGALEASFGYVKRFKIGTVDGDADVQLSYSEVEMTSARNLKLDSKYSEFEIQSAGEVSSHTQYDDVYFGTVKSLENTGKYDDIEVESVEHLDIETRYSNVDIDQLSKSGIFDTQYGEVDISGVGANLSSIKIRAAYTGFDIDIDVPYELEVDSKFTGVDYPRGLDIFDRDKDATSLYLQGNYKGGGNAKIEARMRYGHLRL